MGALFIAYHGDPPPWKVDVEKGKISIQKQMAVLLGSKQPFEWGIKPRHPTDDQMMGQDLPLEDFQSVRQPGFLGNPLLFS